MGGRSGSIGVRSLGDRAQRQTSSEQGKEFVLMSVRKICIQQFSEDAGFLCELARLLVRWLLTF